jgi:DNA-binding transcriptional regulator Cro
MPKTTPKSAAAARALYTTDEIIEHFGGPQAIADKLGCTVNNIRMWRGFVPRTVAYEIQVKSDGKFLVERMPFRPVGFRSQSSAA